MNDENEGSKKHVVKRYKDVARDQLLEQMNGEKNHNDSDVSDGEQRSELNDNDDLKSRLQYDDEQKELRSAFLDSNNNENDDDDWLIKKNKSDSNDDLDPEFEKQVQRELETLDKNSSKDSDLKDPKGELENADKFLFDFIKNKRWVDQNEVDKDDDDDDEKNQKSNIIGGDDNDDDASLDELERTDQFESKYNFRFEEANENGSSGASHSIVGYSRASLSNTVRRQDDTRKKKRQQRKERKEAERKAKEEQLRRLKNAKRQEMEERLNEIRSVLGGKNVEVQGEDIDEATMMKLMEGDFDPDKFDELMSKSYGDRYYDKDEVEWKNDLDVRESLKDGEKDIVMDEGNTDGGMYDEYDEQEDDNYVNDDQNAEEFGEEDEDYYYGDDDEQYKGEEETALEKKLKEKMLDELYKLDYEDIIGDMPTRFSYRKVEPNSYGLSPEEILYSRDTTLKQFVSLKKMAPYREDGEYHPDTRKRRRFREMAKQDFDEFEKDYEMSKAEEEKNNVGSSKKKRRRQKKGSKKAANEKETVVQNNDDGEKATENIKPEETKKRRKKKGKKLDKRNGVKESEMDAKEKEVAKIMDTEKDEKSKTKTKKNHQKNEKDKKRKRKNPSQPEGISASRLASYGLLK